MGKATGFLEYGRITAADEPPQERVRHYREFAGRLDEPELSRQGARCMDCGIPFCHSSYGCPVLNLIPEWNDFVYRNQWQEAYERLDATNNFPEFTGRACPAPCESACTLAINDSPVTIKQIELAIIEKAFDEGWVRPCPPEAESGKMVAIVGSGPAGLAAAQQLRRAGHRVTVFEKSPKIGGLLRYGIPDFKLEKRIIDRRLAQLSAEGIEFRTDVNIGEDISVRYLNKSFDAMLITTGAGQARDLKIPGRGLEGIHFAMDYLTRSNMHIDGMIGEGELISARDKNVLVIGGGDTGSDCVGTANRQGARSVVQYEILPKPPEWTHSWNPDWPRWPNVLRTSSSHEEGAERDWAIVTEQFRGQQGKLNEAVFHRVDWNTGAGNGRPVMKKIAGSEFTLAVDLVLIAAGFEHVEHGRLIRDLNPRLDGWNNLWTDENHMTSVPGVFAAGDSRRGASLIVHAVYDGRQAAAGIHRHLSPEA